MKVIRIISLEKLSVVRDNRMLPCSKIGVNPSYSEIR